MKYYNKKTAKIFASIVMAAFTLFLIYSLRPYISTFLGAVVFSIIFLPLYRKLEEKRGGKKTNATIVILIVILLLVIPMLSIIPLLIQQINQTLLDSNTINDIRSVVQKNFSFIDISELPSITQKIGSSIQDLLSAFVGSAATILINLTIFFFTLFYILLNYRKLTDLLMDIIPFKKTNNRKLIQNFKDITRSTLISTFLIALFQSILLGIALAALDVPGALLWTFVSFILALFPVVGIPLVWIPAVIILVAQDSLIKAAILTIVGLILSNVDIFIRSWIQKRYGQIHPLITLIGVIMGISVFGIIGIFIGPILISYFLLMAKMYQQEYL